MTRTVCFRPALPVGSFFIHPRLSCEGLPSRLPFTTTLTCETLLYTDQPDQRDGTERKARLKLDQTGAETRGPVMRSTTNRQGYNIDILNQRDMMPLQFIVHPVPLHNANHGT